MDLNFSMSPDLHLFIERQVEALTKIVSTLLIDARLKPKVFSMARIKGHSIVIGLFKVYFDEKCLKARRVSPFPTLPK